MNSKLAAVVIAGLVLTGCASVPMESTEASNQAKQFSAPPADKAGVYVYRNSFVGKALKKDIWIDGKCVGESAPDTFFYQLVDADVEHKVATESEFSPNDLTFKTEAGKNYFVQQYIKMGLLVGGAGVRLVDEETGKKAVSTLELAKPGTCSK